ncbi:MAG: hypothetical protein WCB27_15325 [Thermoguttaceae bacterium]|jgi:hypothetical protein
MQLDRNRIVIRERGWLDVLDLALRVTRVYAWPLLVTLAVGVVPFMLLNAWLLGGIAEPDFDEPAPFAYLWWMLILVLFEMPLATALATLYLGEAVFQERPRVRSLVGGLFRGLPQLFWFQVVLRAFLIPLVITWFVPFSVWPYMNEVILLERNPLRRRRRGQMTTFRRSMALHGGNIGDLFARWLGSVGLGGLLFGSFWLTMQGLAGVLVSEWRLEGLTYTLYFPLALWMTIGYFTVARFLGYVDLRIRNEGWEVELMVRAEAARMSRQLT